MPVWLTENLEVDSFFSEKVCRPLSITLSLLSSLLSVHFIECSLWPFSVFIDSSIDDVLCCFSHKVERLLIIIFKKLCFIFDFLNFFQKKSHEIFNNWNIFEEIFWNYQVWYWWIFWIISESYCCNKSMILTSWKSVFWKYLVHITNPWFIQIFDEPVLDIIESKIFKNWNLCIIWHMWKSYCGNKSYSGATSASFFICSWISCFLRVHSAANSFQSHSCAL